MIMEKRPKMLKKRYCLQAVSLTKNVQNYDCVQNLLTWFSSYGLASVSKTLHFPSQTKISDKRRGYFEGLKEILFRKAMVNLEKRWIKWLNFEKLCLKMKYYLLVMWLRRRLLFAQPDKDKSIEFWKIISPDQSEFEIFQTPKV